MDVDDFAGISSTKFLTQYLHISGEHDYIDLLGVNSALNYSFCTTLL